jgi:hypothetical protein
MNEFWRGTGLTRSLRAQCPLRPGIAGAIATACAAKPIRTVDHLRRLTHLVIADLEATGWSFAGAPPPAGTVPAGTQVMKISGQAAARTRLHHHEAAAAGFHPVSVESAAYDHKAYDPSRHRTTMRVTGDRSRDYNPAHRARRQLPSSGPGRRDRPGCHRPITPIPGKRDQLRSYRDERPWSAPMGRRFAEAIRGLFPSPRS